MTDDRLSAVQRLFDRAASVPPSDREAFLSEACGSDAALRREVSSLLQSADGAGDFLAGEAIDRFLPPPRALPDPAEMLGRAIGAYRIERLIGAGGMGVVYLARQTDPERPVALKLIRPELTTPRLARRLHDEAAVLARLRHPGIAQIYEAGGAGNGPGALSFFAMEFVPGQSLVEYANDRRLSVHERLELLARVGDALQHAHHQGVIHRDLKPQNILVVADDDGDRPGQPKIIDFGVARITDTAPGTPADRLTVDRLVGTLSYMSPEQFQDPREGPDIRSDIYALGVIAYELLTGQLPHGLRDQSIAEAARTITESTPLPLGAHDRALRGDVEIIVMTALAREKERRYQSAAGLAADLRRAIRGEPISARPPSVWYELSRHARRNKPLYAAAILAFLLLLAATIGTSVGVLRARANAAAMEQAYDESEAVTSFVERMIASVDPFALGRRDVPMREVLDRMSRALEEEFSESPLVRARLHHFVGTTLGGLGLWAEGVPHLRRAVEARQSLLGADHARTIETTAMLGEAARKLGDFDESVRLLTDVLRRRERLLGLDHADTLASYRPLSAVYFEMSRFDDADALVSPAWDRARAVLGDRHETTLGLAEAIASIKTEKGEARKAEPIIRQVFDTRVRELGEAHPRALRAANVLSHVYLRDGRFADAERVAARAYELRRQTFGDEHLETLASALVLGRALLELSRYDEANRLFSQVTAGYRRDLGPDHPVTLQAMLALSQSWRALGRLEENASVAEEVLGAARRTLGEDHLTTLSATAMLARTHDDLGQHEQARALWSDLLDTQRRVLGDRHPRTVDTMHNLAASLSNDETMLERSAALFEGALEIRRSEEGIENPRSLFTASRLGDVYRRQGRLDEALVVLSETVEVGRRSLPEDHWYLGLFLRRWAACLAAMERFGDAEAALLESRRIFDLRLGSGHAETLQAQADLDALRERWPPAKAAEAQSRNR